MNQILENLKKFTSQSDLVVAIGLLLVVCVMIVPVPPFILDLFFATTFSSSVIILLICVYANRPLDFSTFPSLLLVTTLFRISLNISSTRNILLNGPADGVNAAGQIIQSFGEFVVQGNYAVGIVVFVILVIFNFMVITKGAGRVAEVSARFTLDAMPGKQMAIDADLNAGLINDVEAKRRRKEIAEEADFYGSMDGASKFVRGDAIAGLIVTFINIIGGIFIGVFQGNMEVSAALETFTLLTIGDGLVAQIPAIIISTAAGILATRNNTDKTLGKQMGDQVMLHPKAILAGAGTLFILPVLGMPLVPFWSVGGVLAYFAIHLEKKTKVKDQKDILAVQEEKKNKAENLEDLLSVELVQLEVGYGLVNLVDVEQSGDLLERITHIRKQMALDWGVIVPSVKIKDNLEIKPGSYLIKIKGIVVSKGDLITDHFLAMDPGTVIDKMEGIETIEPVFGLPAVWITEGQKEDAQYNGYTVVDLSTIIATHLTEILKTHLHELFGRQELVRILDNLKADYPKVVEDLIPELLSLGAVLKVLQNLLRESISIRDLRTILEALAEAAVISKDSEFLTERSRQSLYRTITESLKTDQGDVPIFSLDRKIEDTVYKSIVRTEHGVELALEPSVTQTILAGLNEKIEEATQVGEKMIVLCSPQVRPHFKRLTEKFIPQLTVISHNEIGPETKMRSLGTVRL
jgi:flagellar biosynthesis protein FlhA